MSNEDVSLSNRPPALASSASSPQTLSAYTSVSGVLTQSKAQDMPKTKPNHRPSALEHTSPFPPMALEHAPGADPFLVRVTNLIAEWVQKEWLAIDNVKREAARHGWTPQFREQAILEVTLTPDNLARSLDNISQPTLRRELSKLNAPPPGELIRNARLDFAKHLMTHTRMMGRDIAIKVGFAHYRYFAGVFTDTIGMSPSQYRRRHVKAHSGAADSQQSE